MTEVALDTVALHAPSAIQLLLAKVGIRYTEVPEHLATQPSRRVQTVLLGDAVGTLMVLFAQDQLLDLSRLAEVTGRKLTVVPL